MGGRELGGGGWCGWGWGGGWGVGIPFVEVENTKLFISCCFFEVLIPYSRFPRIDETNLNVFRHAFFMFFRFQGSDF